MKSFIYTLYFKIFYNTKEQFQIKEFLDKIKPLIPAVHYLAILSILTTIFSFIEPFLLKYLIDYVFIEKHLEYFLILLLLISFVALLKTIISISHNLYSDNFDYKYRMFFELGYLKKFLHTNIITAKKYAKGDVLARIGEIVSTRKNIKDFNVDLYLIFVYAIFVPFIFYLIDIRLVLIMVMISLYNVLISGYLKKYFKLYDYKSNIVGAHLGNLKIDIVNGHKEIKIFNLPEYFLKKVSSHLFRLRSINVKEGLISNSKTITINIFEIAATFLYNYFAVKLIIANKMTVGDYFAFTTLLNYCLKVPDILSSGFRNMNKLIVSIQRFNDIMSKDAPDSTETSHTMIQHAHQTNISVSDLCFSYDEEGSPILNGISFSAKSGDMIGITGVNGSGKTTLVSILAGLYKPTSGNIMYSFNEQDYKDQISFLQQTPYIFNTSIKENITFNEPNIDNKKLINLLEEFELLDKINYHPNGLDTVLGEKGINFSQGEQQKLALIRFLLRPKKLLLIDEGLNSLDSKTKELVNKKIHDIRKERDCIVIIATHNKVIMDSCSCLYKLEKGVLIPC